MSKLGRLLSLRMRIVLVTIALFAAVSGFFYWQMHWRPDAGIWRMQGVALSPRNAPFDWPILAHGDARFVYLDAVGAGRGTGNFFTANRAEALAAGMHVGATFRLSTCSSIADQVTDFVRLVPRDAEALPPLLFIHLDKECERRPTRALLLSEIGTLVSQLETHTGKTVIVGISEALEDEYHVAAAINRPLLLDNPRSTPDAESGPWALWLANDKLRIDGAVGSVDWLVLNDSEG